MIRLLLSLILLFFFLEIFSQHISLSNESTTGDLKFELGTSEYMRLTSAGRLGIGIVSPSTFLHVNKGFETTTAENLMEFTVDDAASSYLKIRNRTSTDGLFVPQISVFQKGVTTLPALSFNVATDIDGVGDSPVFNINVAYNNGTVGPILNRSLFGIDNNGSNVFTVDNNGQITVTGGAPAAGKALVSSNTDGLAIWQTLTAEGLGGWSITGNTGTSTSNFIGTTDTQALKFKTNNTDRMVITSTGNVGIGTSTVSGVLHVKNNTLTNNQPASLIVENGHIGHKQSGAAVAAPCATGFVCTDVRGVVQGGGSSGTINVTFATAYSIAPVVILTPANIEALIRVTGGTSDKGYYVTTSTSGFTLFYSDLKGSSPQFNYWVIE